MARFHSATFSGNVDFSNVDFKGRENSFKNVLFENQDKVLFNHLDLSRVSFAYADITRVRFGENIVWGGKDGTKMVDEEMLENSEKYLFRWDKVPGNNKDAKRLIDYIKMVSGADWIDKDLKFVKYNDRKIITSKESHSNLSSNNHTEDVPKKDIHSFH